jgi:hypothetical protein
MTTVTTSVHGTVAPGYDDVRDAFRDNFTRFAEKGAACAAYVDGLLVVDLWGGEADGTAAAFARAVADPTSLAHRALRPTGTGFGNETMNDPRAHAATPCWPTRPAGPAGSCCRPRSSRSCRRRRSRSPGRAGHVGLGDTDRRVGFAYTMTAMFGNLTGDPRPRAVLDALARCLP